MSKLTPHQTFNLHCAEGKVFLSSFTNHTPTNPHAQLLIPLPYSKNENTFSLAIILATTVFLSFGYMSPHLSCIPLTIPPCCLEMFKLYLYQTREYNSRTKVSPCCLKCFLEIYYGFIKLVISMEGIFCHYCCKQITYLEKSNFLNYSNYLRIT